MQTTVAEIEQLAALCATLQLKGEEHSIASSLLEPIGSALGADSAAYRCFVLEQERPRISTLVSVGVPSTVTDAYLSHFHRFDPALALLDQSTFHNNPHSGPAAYPLLPNKSAGVAANANFQRYHHEFLLPNGLVHHAGFLLQDRQGERAWLFNFHRRAAAPDFGKLELARARLISSCLQGQALAQRPDAGVKQGADLHLLSSRERDICATLARGLANKQISARLGISPRTVENHLRNIYSKLRLSSRTQLLTLLMQQNYNAQLRS